MLFKLTRMVMCLDGAYHSYQKSMMMQLLILMYQKKEDLPQWRMLVGSVSVYNEEAGELSFSVLSRVVLGDNLKAKFEHMDKMYKLTRTYAASSDLLREEMQRTKRKNGYYMLTHKHVEVRTVTTFMLEKIRALTLNVFTEYTGPTRGKDSKNNPAYLPNANLHQKYTSLQRLWLKDIIGSANNTMRAYQKACSGTWAKDVAIHTVFPGFDNPMRVAALADSYEDAIRVSHPAKDVPGSEDPRFEASLEDSEDTDVDLMPCDADVPGRYDHSSDESSDEEADEVLAKPARVPRPVDQKSCLSDDDSDEAPPKPIKRGRPSGSRNRAK